MLTASFVNSRHKDLTEYLGDQIMKKHTEFWNKNARRYDRFMKKDVAAYAELYELLRPVVRHKTVLELATGTGLIAKNIVNSAAQIEATDASKEMIVQAKLGNNSSNLHFSVQDMFHLPYAIHVDIVQ